MNDRTDPNRLTRRHALRVIGAGVGGAAAVALAACKSESAAPDPKKAAPPAKAAAPKKPSGELNCGALEPIDSKSQNMRKTLQYVEKSTKPGKQCDNCAQWEAAKFPDSKCGGCKLFSGPVNPAGNCLSYAPLKS